MAQFIVTVPDATVARIRTAFGHFNTAAPPVWIDATVAEIQTACKNMLRSGVIEYEVNASAQTKRDAVNQEQWP